MNAIYLVLGIGAAIGFGVWYSRYIEFVKHRRLLDGYYRDLILPIVLICKTEADFNREVSIVLNPDTESDYNDSLYNQVLYEEAMLEEAQNPNGVTVHAIYPYSVSVSIKDNEKVLEAHYGETFEQYQKRATEESINIVRKVQLERAKSNLPEYINRTHAPGYINQVHKAAKEKSEGSQRSLRTSN